MRQHLKLIIVFAISFICLLISCQGESPTHLSREVLSGRTVDEPEPSVIANEQVQISQGYELESSPLYEEIEEFLNDEQNAWMRHRHIGWCGFSMSGAEGNFSWIIKDSPPEHIIPLLQHEAVYLRNVVIRRLCEMGDDALPAIDDAFENGSARIRLELLILNHADSSSEVYFELFDEIIHDESFPVFFQDLHPMWMTSDDTMLMRSIESPVDILAYYIRLMQESDLSTDRGVAAIRLGSFGEVADVAVPALIELLEGEDGNVHPGFGVNNTGLGATNLRGAAAIALGDIGHPGSDVISTLVEALDDEVCQTRCAAASSLNLLGHNQAEMIEYLVELLNEEVNESSYEIIANHLGRIGPDAIDALPRLEVLLVGSESRVRKAARKAVVSIRDGGDELELQLLLAGLSNANPDIRLDSVRELGRWNWESDETIAALYGMLDDENSEVKWAACSDLLNYGYGGPLGPDPDRIIEAVVELVNGIPDSSRACDAIYKIEELDLYLPETIPGLLRLIGSSDSCGTERLIDVILAAGGSYDIINARLLELTQNEDFVIQRHAISMLSQMDEITIDALPVFNEFLHGNRLTGPFHLTARATTALISKIAPNNEAAVPGLLEILDCGQRDVVPVATEKLIEITGDYDLIVGRLIELLDHEQEDTVLEALKALGNLGEHAIIALPKLREIAENGGIYVLRYYAQTAIESIM